MGVVQGKVLLIPEPSREHNNYGDFFFSQVLTVIYLSSELINFLSSSGTYHKMLSFSLCHSAKCSVHIVSTTKMCELTDSRFSIFGNYSGRNNI